MDLTKINCHSVIHVPRGRSSNDKNYLKLSEITSIFKEIFIDQKQVTISIIRQPYYNK